VGGEPRRLRRDQRVAPGRGLDGAALGQDVRPRVTGDLEEFERELPIAIEAVGHDLVEPCPFDAARGHVVHQTRKVVGERKRRCRIVGDQRRLAFLVGRDAGRPLQHELREQHAPLQRAESGRKRERLGRQSAGRGLRERDLILVQVADGDDARQDGGGAPGHLEKAVACEAAGAPGGQIDRRAGKRERIAPGRKTRHQGAVEQRADQRRDERRRGRDGEDSRGCHAESYTVRRRQHEFMRTESYPCTRPIACTAFSICLMSASQNVAKSGPSR
jgi:hypothetical protein